MHLFSRLYKHLSDSVSLPDCLFLLRKRLSSLITDLTELRVTDPACLPNLSFQPDTSQLCMSDPNSLALSQCSLSGNCRVPPTGQEVPSRSLFFPEVLHTSILSSTFSCILLKLQKRVVSTCCLGPEFHCHYTTAWPLWTQLAHRIGEFRLREPCLDMSLNLVIV